MQEKWEIVADTEKVRGGCSNPVLAPIITGDKNLVVLTVTSEEQNGSVGRNFILFYMILFFVLLFFFNLYLTMNTR